MLTQETERLRGIDVEAVVVALGVLKVAQTLAGKLPAQEVSGGRAVGVQGRRAARCPLYQVGDLPNARSRGRIVEVVVTPSPRGIYQPGGRHSAVVADYQVASSVPQLVKGVRVSNHQTAHSGTVRIVVAIGRVAEERRFELMVIAQLERALDRIRQNAVADVAGPQDGLSRSTGRASRCSGSDSTVRGIAE